MLLRVATAILSFMSLTGCMKGPGFLKQGNSEARLSTPIPASVTKDEAGAVTYRVEDDQHATTFNATQQTGVNGATVTIPAGTVAIGTEITMEEGATIIADTTASDLNINGGLNSASQSLIVSSPGAVPAQPFTIQLPLPDSASLTDDPFKFLIVVYKVTLPGEASPQLGAILRADLTIKDGEVTFQTKNFGSFQAAFTKTLVQTVPDVKTPPILTKAEEAVATPVTWNFKTKIEETRYATTTFASSGLADIDRCAAAVDADGQDPIDKILPLAKAQTFTFGPLVTTAHKQFFRVSCRDVNGRESGASDWQQVDVPDIGPRPTVAVTAPASPTNANPMTFSVKFSEKVSGFGSADVTLTNATLVAISGSLADYKVDVKPTAEGPVSVLVKDKAAQTPDGQDSVASTAATSTYDVTGGGAPTVQNPLATSTGTLVWQWATNSASPGSGHYRWKIDSNDFKTGATETDGLAASTNGLSDGTHKLYVQELDADGNWGATGMGTGVTDHTPPVKPAKPRISGPATTNSHAVTINWDLASDPHSKITSYELTYGSLPNCVGHTDTGIAPTTTSLTVDPSVDATYCLKLTAFNEAGLSTTSDASATLTIDRNAPTVMNVTATGTGSTYTGQRTIVVTFTEPVKVTAPAGHKPFVPTTAQNAGSVVNADYSTVTGSSVTFKHTVQVGDYTPAALELGSALNMNGGSITDNAGNPVDPSLAGMTIATAALKMDAAAPGAPTITSPSVANFTTTPSVQFSWASASDDGPNDAPLTYRVNLGTSPGGSEVDSITAASSPLSYTLLTRGQKIYATVQAIDPANNVGTASAASALTVWDDTPPAKSGGSSMSILGVGVYGAKLQWNAATDDVTTSANLRYQVCVSETASNLDMTDPLVVTTANCTAKAANVTSGKTPILTAGTAYKANVAVWDETDNVAVYTPVNIQTNSLRMTYSYNSGGIYGIKTSTKTDSGWSTPSAVVNATVGYTVPVVNKFAVTPANDTLLMTYRENNGSSVAYYRSLAGGGFSLVSGALSSNGAPFTTAFDKLGARLVQLFNYASNIVVASPISSNSFAVATTTNVRSMTTLAAMDADNSVTYVATGATNGTVEVRTSANFASPLNSPPSVTSPSGCLSLLANGNDINVFESANGAFLHLRSTDNGAHWNVYSISTAISCAGDESSHVRRGPGGKIEAVWIDGHNVMHNTFDPIGSSWGTPDTVGTTSTNSELALDVDEIGEAHIVYFDPDNGVPVYKILRGGTWFSGGAPTTGGSGTYPHGRLPFVRLTP